METDLPDLNEETMLILGDWSLMDSIRRSQDDIAKGRLHDQADVWAELNAEFE